MWKIIFSTILLMLPAGMANMAPVLFKWLNFLNVPLDFNKTWNGKPIFGCHKTYRGFLVGIICAIFTVWVLSILNNRFSDFLIVNPRGVDIIYFGGLLGFGALFGDMVKSFFKRRVGVLPGKSWVPFDQIDWIVGALVFVSFYKSIPLIYWFAALLVFGLIHPIVNLIGYWLKIKSNRF